MSRELQASSSGERWSGLRSAALGLARGHFLPLLLLAGLATAVRLHELGHESLWIDEAISYGRARLPLDELLADTIKRKHLPTYFLLLRAVLGWGDSEWMLRLPSVVFGVASAGLAYGLGAVAGGRLAGFTAGLLFALSELQVHYAQEARMYTLLSFATASAMLGTLYLAKHPEAAAISPRGLWRALRQGPTEPGAAPRSRTVVLAWLATVFGTVLALYTHNTAPFFVIALNAGALAAVIGSGHARLGFARNWLACMALAFALWSPWLPTLLRQTEMVRRVWKGREATLEWTQGVLMDVFVLGRDGGPLAYVLVALGLAALWPLRRDKRLFVTLLLFALLAPLLLFAASQSVPIFYRRLLLWAAPPWFALVGVGLCGLPRGLAAAGCLALGLAAVPRLQAYYTAETKPNWRPMLQQLSADTDQHSLILNARAERFLFYYYERKDDPVPFRDTVKVSNRPRKLEKYIGDTREFYVVGQTHAAAYKAISAAIEKDGRYRRVAYRRHADAVVLKFRRKRGK